MDSLPSDVWVLWNTLFFIITWRLCFSPVTLSSHLTNRSTQKRLYHDVSYINPEKTKKMKMLLYEWNTFVSRTLGRGTGILFTTIFTSWLESINPLYDIYHLDVQAYCSNVQSEQLRKITLKFCRCYGHESWRCTVHQSNVSGSLETADLQDASIHHREDIATWSVHCELDDYILR